MGRISKYNETNPKSIQYSTTIHRGAQLANEINISFNIGKFEVLYAYELGRVFELALSKPVQKITNIYAKSKDKTGIG